MGTGGIIWCAVVVTVMVVVDPDTTDAGIAEHVESAAGKEQVTLTMPLKPSVPAIATLYSAGFPATTIAEVVCGVSVKSGPMTVKFAEVGVDVGK
jgi:hypothetical protein